MTTTPHLLTLDQLSLSREAPGWLLGHVSIAGVDFHVEAVEVEDAERGSLSAVNHEVQNRLDAVADYDEGWGDGYQTVSIDGKPHFLILIPFQR